MRWSSTTQGSVLPDPVVSEPPARPAPGRAGRRLERQVGAEAHCPDGELVGMLYVGLPLDALPG